MNPPNRTPNKTVLNLFVNVKMKIHTHASIEIISHAQFADKEATGIGISSRTTHFKNTLSTPIALEMKVGN